MAVISTYLQKREEHRETYKSGGRITQVDYILCRDCKMVTYKMVTGETVDRQHQMVVCSIILVVKERKRAKVEQRIKWWKLKKEDCCKDFRERLKQTLGGHEELLDDWVTTATVIRETGRGVGWCVIWTEDG